MISSECISIDVSNDNETLAALAGFQQQLSRCLDDDAHPIQEMESLLGIKSRLHSTLNRRPELFYTVGEPRETFEHKNNNIKSTKGD